MQYSPTLASSHSSVTQIRPTPCSLDCGEEFSLDHWLELSWLVEREEEDLAGYLLEDSCIVGSR